jgi:transcriptional regulator with XRE-family HTH domain
MHVPSPTAADLTMNVAVVQDLMTQRDWTWADLSREMGMSKSTISRVVQGRTLPGRRFIFALERVFPDVPRADLFTAVPDEQDAA